VEVKRLSWKHGIVFLKSSDKILLFMQIFYEKRSAMKLTQEEEAHIRAVLGDCIRDPKVQEMKNYIQHGAVSTYDHCKSVTQVSYWMNRHFHLGADERELLFGAFLHDFYLYDWHDSTQTWHRLHGYRHPEFARKNAVKYFRVDEGVQRIITSHMWPLTITKVPTSREAVIVCIADKYVSSIETLKKRKVREQYVAK
jgi:uncharacterized protein